MDKILTAEVTEQATRALLPTKVSASHEEGLELVVERAKALVDIYTAPPPGHLLPAGARERGPDGCADRPGSPIPQLSR